MIIWRFPSNSVTRSFGHEPKFPEPNPAYEEDNCWNCGGELFIERAGAGTAFDTERCPVCGGTGYVASGVMPFSFNDWVNDRKNLPLIYHVPDATKNWKP